MAAADDKVMSLVERELEKDPQIENQALYEKAQKVDPEVAKLTLRQFHAKYPLQVKRRSPATKKKGGKPRKSKGARKTRKKAAATKSTGRSRRAAQAATSHEAVRKVLLRFAKDVSAAEGKAETIGVLANVDRYVTDILKASGT